MNVSKSAIRVSNGPISGVGPASRPPDPFYVERNIGSWASSRVVARGRDYYRQGRVSSLDLDENGDLVARVSGSTDQIYRIEMRLAHSEPPSSRCTGPYNWEPLCKHAVAALLAWQQSETGAEPRLGAVSIVMRPPRL